MTGLIAELLIYLIFFKRKGRKDYLDYAISPDYYHHFIPVGGYEPLVLYWERSDIKEWPVKVKGQWGNQRLVWAMFLVFLLIFVPFSGSNSDYFMAITDQNIVIYENEAESVIKYDDIDRIEWDGEDGRAGTYYMVTDNSERYYLRGTGVRGEKGFDAANMITDLVYEKCGYLLPKVVVETKLASTD